MLEESKPVNDLFLILNRFSASPSQQQKVELLKKAIRNGADLAQQESTQKKKLLHEAVAVGLLIICKYLVEECQCDPNALDENKKTPLMYAVSAGRLDIVNYLRSKGAILQGIPKWIFMVNDAHHATFFQHWFEKCRSEEPDFAQKLLENSFCVAVRHGQISIVQYLNRRYKNELQTFLSNPDEKRIFLHGYAVHVISYPMWSYLFDEGLLNIKDIHFDLLKTTVKCGLHGAAQHLIEQRGVDPSVVDKDGKNLLLKIAYENERLEIVLYLVMKQWADLREIAADENEFLQYLVQYGNVDSVKRFIAILDIEKTASYEKTAQSYALDYEKPEVFFGLMPRCYDRDFSIHSVKNNLKHFSDVDFFKKAIALIQKRGKIYSHDAREFLNQAFQEDRYDIIEYLLGSSQLIDSWSKPLECPCSIEDEHHKRTEYKSIIHYGVHSGLVGIIRDLLNARKIRGDQVISAILDEYQNAPENTLKIIEGMPIVRQYGCCNAQSIFTAAFNHARTDLMEKLLSLQWFVTRATEDYDQQDRSLSSLCDGLKTLLRSTPEPNLETPCVHYFLKAIRAFKYDKNVDLQDSHGRTVFDFLNEPTDLPGINTLLQSVIREVRKEKFLFFCLGRHTRVGAKSSVHVLVDDVVGLIYQAYCHH